MEHRPLGRTGLQVSLLGLGTMTFGQQNTEAEGFAQMDRAVAAGINLFDAAEMYPIPPKAETQGATETIIGNWLKARGSAVRQGLVIATKAAGRGPMGWLRREGGTIRHTRAQLREAVAASLQRLQVERIDLYQLHWPDRVVGMFGSWGTTFRKVRDEDWIPVEDILGWLGEMVEEGKIAHLGLSNETAWGTMAFLRAAETRGLPRVATVQNAYSLINRTYEMGLAEVSLREDVGLLAYSALGQGYLTGKYENGALPEGSRKQLFNRLQRYEKPETAPAIRRYLDLAQGFGRDPAQFAIQFAATRAFTASVLLGATTMEQLEIGLGALDRPWTEEMEKAVDAAHQAQPNPAP